MISTRLHGLIDYGVSALFAGLAADRGLPRRTRAVLGSAAAYHASYAAVTDYEAGFSPRFTMRQHLALDMLGAAGLCAASLLLRREPTSGRALLLAAGLAEFAVIAASNDAPTSGPGQGSGALDRMLPPPAPAKIGYAPLDVPKPFAAGVWIVDSLMPGVMGRVLPIRMTVLRLRDGGLLLHSPTPFSPAVLEQVQALGPIRHLVAPNLAHWMYLRDWQQACPGATTWAAPGLRQRGNVRRSGVWLDAELGDHTPTAWGDAVTLLLVPGGLGFAEATLFHTPSRTLVLTDLVLNLELPKLPAIMRPLVRLFGSDTGSAKPPPYLRAIVKLRRRAAAQAAQRILALRPERVVFAHGRCFERDGTPALRHAWRWLIA